jgi:hypothetical protein
MLASILKAASSAAQSGTELHIFLCVVKISLSNPETFLHERIVSLYILVTYCFEVKLLTYSLHATESLLRN